MQKHAESVEVFTQFDYEKNEGTVESTYIYPMGPESFLNAVRLFREVMEEVPSNPELSSAVEKGVEIFRDVMEKREQIIEEGKELKQTPEEISERVRVEAMQQADFTLFKNSAAAIGFIADYIPSRLVDVMSVLTGLRPEIIKLQDMDTFFDLYDAALKVNDIEKLVNRAKKSMEYSQKVLNFKSMVQEATGKAKESLRA